MSPPSPSDQPSPRAGVSRRDFLRGLGTAAVSTAALSAAQAAQDLQKLDPERIQGPDAVAVTLMLNGERRAFQVAPRTTLLEVLRTQAGLTGAKESCDRGSCGTCTVLLGDDPVYACSLLAIEAQGAEITTVEGLARNGELSRLQQFLVGHDGLQCGYCTPGFTITLTALLRRNPHPTHAEIRRACTGHLCRCGSYPRVFSAALAAAGAGPAAPHTCHPQRVSDDALA